MSTIFTKIIEGEIPSYKIAEDTHFYAFLDINPLQKGHVLVVPKQETDYLFDLENDLLSDLILFAKKIAEAIKISFDCNRVGMTVIGLEVPHAHIHLIPINGEKDMNFANPKLKLSPLEFQEVSKLISSNLYQF